MSASSPALSPALPPQPCQALTRWAQWQGLADELTALLCQPFDAHPTFEQALGRAAGQLIELTRLDPDVAIFHMVHTNPDKMRRYGVLHAMHTSMLLTLIGRRKDWGDARISTAVMAGLTMNLSITSLQNELVRQGAPLTPPQREAIEAHPLASAQMLRELGVQDEDWLTAVAQHHEQADGKGYPKGLIQLNMLADAIHTCDVFGAKMSARAGRRSMASPKAAADIFRQSSAGYFGATIIRELGLYPPGCLVTLSTGEQAVVVRRSRDPHAPDIVVFRDGAGQALPEPRHSNTRCSPCGHSRRTITGSAADQPWPEQLTPQAVLALV